MHAAHTAAGWLRIGTLLAFAGLFSVPALSQFTSRAAPEPLIRGLNFFSNSPLPGNTTLYASSLGGGMFKGVDDGTNITWTPHATALPTTRLFSTFFVDQTTFFVMTDGYGAHTVFECSGGSGVLEGVMPWLRRGGRIVLLAFFRQPPAVDVDRLLNHEIELVGSRGKRASSYRTALRLMAQGQVDVEAIVGAKLPLDEWEKGIELVGRGVKVVLEVKPE